MFCIPAIYLYSLGAALFAIVGMLIAHYIVKPIDLSKNQACLDATLNIVGTLVSILLGLLVAASLSNYQTLAADVDSEATGVADICRLSLALPLPKQKEILTLCAKYCDQVSAAEWAAMEAGHPSPIAFGTYIALLKTIVTYNPVSAGQNNIHQTMLTAVQSVGDYRRHRMLWLNSTWNKNLLPVVIMCALIVLVFAYLYVQRTSYLLHGFLICFVATALGANLGMIALLSNPFKGDWKLQPKGFEVNSTIIKQYLSTLDK